MHPGLIFLFLVIINQSFGYCHVASMVMSIFLLIIWMLQTSLLLYYFSCHAGVIASEFDESEFDAAFHVHISIL